MLRRFLVSWALLAVAVVLTAGLLPGIHIDGGLGALLVIALVWGLVDGLLGPIARLLSLPITLMTFGLFALVVNGLLLRSHPWIADSLQCGQLRVGGARRLRAHAREPRLEPVRRTRARARARARARNAHPIG